MAPQKRKGGGMILLKSLVLVITGLSFLGVLSCNNSGTNSTASSSGGSGTGTGWTVSIQVGTNPIVFNEVTTVMATVKDGTGAPAPSGTNICFTAVRNGFLSAGKPIATLCGPTTNNLGQMIQSYYAYLETGDDIIEVSSQGVIATRTITVNN